MLKDNEKNFSRLHMIIDAIVLVLSYFLAWLIRFVGPMAATAVRTRSFQQYMLMLVFIVPVYLLLYQAFTLYTPMRMQGRPSSGCGTHTAFAQTGLYRFH